MLKKIFAANVVFVAALAVVPGAYASCNNLIVDLDVPGWRIVSTTGEGACAHGQIQSVAKDGSQALLSNVGDYGPDCKLQMSSSAATSVVNVQQNFCVLERGDITVKWISGEKPDHVGYGGAYSGGKAGRVIIKAFNADAPERRVW